MNLRDELIGVFRLLRTPEEFRALVDKAAKERSSTGERGWENLSDQIWAQIHWWVKKALPHVDYHELFVGVHEFRPVEEDVDLALKLEAERAHLPKPRFITHEMLLDNVGYLQQRARDLGETNIQIIEPFELEWPKIRLGEMIWKTHVDASPEEIVEEIYRRQPEARIETGGLASFVSASGRRSRAGTNPFSA